MKKKIKPRKGVFPDENLSVILDRRDSWILFYTPANYETDWMNVKLGFDGKHDYKANYSLAWNGHRFAGSREISVLARHEPELLAWLMKTLPKY